MQNMFYCSIFRTRGEEISNLTGKKDIEELPLEIIILPKPHICILTAKCQALGNILFRLQKYFLLLLSSI